MNFKDNRKKTELTRILKKDLINLQCSDAVFEELRNLDELWFLNWELQNINPAHIREAEKGSWK